MTTAGSESRYESQGAIAVNSTQTSSDSQRQSAIKPPAPRLKVIIRRLSPGLTREEFMSCLGSEWNVGQGRVNWASFKPGKISKDPSKPSRPTRAYLHLTDESYLNTLAETIRKSSFGDMLNTFHNQYLIGPPTIEYAPFGYIPSSKLRVDARTGTIDQDPEFMAFLEGIANPTKDHVHDTSINLYPKQEKITTTPLVQYLREKKASKSKDLTTKIVKKQEAQQKMKSIKESNPTPDDTKKNRESKAERSSSKATKEAVKILNRDTVSKTSFTSLKTTTSSISEKKLKIDVEKPTLTRHRGIAINAHIRMLHRDLGISPNQTNQQVRLEITDKPKPEKSATNEKELTNRNPHSQSTPSKVIPTAPRGKSNLQNKRLRSKGHPKERECNISVSTTSRPATPVVLLKKPDALRKVQSTSIDDPVTPSNKPKPATPSSRKSQPVTSKSDNMVQAFVKHVNLSQGITESLLKQTMENFGEVSCIEIDKRKGFAYVNFIDTEGLKKAMAASPIPIAQGAVQVMPRKGNVSHSEKKTIQQGPHASSRNGRGGRSGNAGRKAGKTASKNGTKKPSNQGLDHGKHTISSPNEITEK